MNGEVYVGQISRMIEIRCQECRRHLWHGQSEKSALAERLINGRHEIQFEKTDELNRTTTYVDGMAKEAIEIQLHSKNFNIEASLTLSRTWQLVISIPKHSTQTLTEDKGRVCWSFDFACQPYWLAFHLEPRLNTVLYISDSMAPSCH
jgi:hypothetical protein